MKSFKLDQDGDVVIKNGNIEMVEGIELIVQTLKQVIGTNLQEWFDDENEGIDFSVIFVKSPNYDLIQDTINTAVKQVAESFSVELETDGFTFETKGRQLTITFTLRMNENESTEVNVTL